MTKDNLIEETTKELLLQVGMNLEMGRVDSTLREVFIETLTDLYAKGENEKWVKNNELAYEAGKAAGREEGIGDGFYRGQVLGEKKARAEFAKEVHAKILSMKDEKTTGIYRLVNAHELVCWLQESELKDL